MTTHCWGVDPTKRPTIDHVLDTLRIAAEQWKPKHGGISTQDDWNSTDSEEESDPPTVLEPKNEPVDDIYGSLDPLQSLVIETPVPAPAPPSVSPPSTTKDHTYLESTLTVSKREEIKSAPAIPSKKQPRLKIVIPVKGGRDSLPPSEPAPIGLSSEEGHKPIPAMPPREEGYKPISVPLKEERRKLIHAPSREEQRKLVHAPSREEERKLIHASSREKERKLIYFPSMEEERKFIPAPSSNQDIRVASIVPPKQEEKQN